MFTEVMPSNHRPTKHPPVYQEVNKNRNPNKKNQLAAQGDRGYINHPLNGTGKPLLVLAQCSVFRIQLFSTKGVFNLSSQLSNFS